MKAEKKTITQIRKMLFDNHNLYAVIGDTEMDNTEARVFLFCIPEQQETRFIIANDTHILIY